MGANRAPARLFRVSAALLKPDLFPFFSPFVPSPSRFMSTTVSLDAATVFAAIALAAVT